MAFFNYSTMQLAAKIVYYGPGLCGKTTNLEFIYGHTTNESRGEMVSLETSTDRTLFFDLLPVEVGSIGGFKTRIQLYTVPGQVFYNTTRKLVLKGVDGVVFVADSQRPMLDANVESLKNLRENLSGMGIEIDKIPLVLQYNKRDLADISSRPELDEVLNKHGWEAFEASALKGNGVFETLKAISRLTLLELSKRLERESHQQTIKPKAATVPPAAMKKLAPPAAPAAAPKPSANGYREIRRDIQLRLGRDQLARAKGATLRLQLTDPKSQVIHSSEDLTVEIPAGGSDLQKLLLRLNIAVDTRD